MRSFLSYLFNIKIIELAKNPSSLSIEFLKNELNHFFVEIDITDRTHLNYTPLMWAVHNGQRKKIDLLLDKKANPYLTTSEKNNLLHIAATRNHLEIYQYLAQCFPTLMQMQNEEGLVPQQLLDYALHSCTTAILHQEFLSSVKDPDCQSLSSINQLENNENFNIDIREFCDYKTNKPFHYSYTPLMWAVYLGELDKVKLLIKHKANPNLTTDNGNTLLHIAASQGHVLIYRYLAHHFPQLLYVRGENNMTPEELASFYNQSAILETHHYHFSNPFFPRVKQAIPKELAAYIGGFIHDTVEIKNLSCVNRDWHILLNEPQFKFSFANYVRNQLPKGLRELPWALIVSHYFPDMSGTITIDNELDWLKWFIQKITTFYIIGNSMALGSVEPSTVYSDYRGYGYYPNQPRTIKIFAEKYISENEMKNNYLHLLTETPHITIYRLLSEALQEEYTKNPNVFFSDDEYYQRSPVFVHTRTHASPIYEVTIRLELALKLLENQLNQHRIHSDAIISVKNYYLNRTTWRKGISASPKKITVDKNEMPIREKEKSILSP